METRKGGEFLPGPFPGGRAATQVRPYASIAAYSSPRRGGTKPAPYRGRSRGVAGCAWGVASASQIPKRNLGRQSWSPRPTGATLAVCSNGPMYLRHGFRRPNFVPKFGASVMGIGPYGEKGKLPRPPGPAAHSGASAARSRGMGRNRSRDHPRSVQQRRTIPQSACG